MPLGSILGQAHLKASDWVNAFQNPFGKTLSKIFDPLKKASDSGTLTYDQANAGLEEFNQQWTAYQSAAQQWTDKGGDFAKVIKQNYDPGGDFMKTLNMVKTSLTDWTGSLQPADTTGDNGTGAPPSLQTLLTSLGLTSEGAASGAAAQVQKKAQSATKTLLTGGKGLPELTAANRKTTTLLGYA